MQNIQCGRPFKMIVAEGPQQIEKTATKALGENS
jgi:hypothetical protein